MVHATSVSTAFLVLSGLLSLALLAFAVLAYRRSRAPALAFVAGAFVIFGLKSFLVAYALWTEAIEHDVLELMDAIGDLVTVLMLFAPLVWPARSP